MTPRALLLCVLCLGAPGTLHAQVLPERDGLCRVEWDESADGIVDSVATYTYDAVGGLLEERYDGDADGTPEVIASYVRSRGRVSAVRAVWTATGQVFRTVEVEYDGRDRIAELRFDADGDGRLDRGEAYTYDELDRVVRTRIDLNGDGRADQVADFSYSDEGHLVRETLDADLDGAPEFDARSTYSGAYRTREAIDTDGDGRDNIVQICLPDPAERSVFCEQDIDGDGSFDVIHETWLDQVGRHTVLALHPSPSPSVQQHVAIEYEAMERHPLADRFAGLVGRRLVDGLPNEIRRFTRDPIGRLSVEEIDSNRDGFVDRRVLYHYACEVEGSGTAP